MIDWTEYEGLIAHNVRSLRINEDEVADVVQDTFVNLMARDWDDEEVKNPAALASQAGRWAAMDHLKKRTNRFKFEGEYSEEDSVRQYYGTTDDQGNTGEMVVVSKGVSPETLAIENDLVMKSMAILTDEQRQAVYLIDMMGFTYQEAADYVSISKQSFHRRHTRARAGLKRWRSECGC